MATAAPPLRRTPPALRRVLGLAAALVGLLLVAQGALVLLDLMAREDVTIERGLGAARTVVVDSDNGEVTVRAGRGPARVRTELTRGLFGGSVDVRAGAGAARIRSDCPPLGTVTCGARHDVRVPAGTAVRVRTGSGDVLVAGVTGRAVELRTGSGTIRVRGARAARLSAQTGSGDVEADGLAVRTATLRTGSGHVSADAVAPPRALSARTGSGDVTVAVPDVPYAVDADTGSGDLDVTVDSDDDAPYGLALETGSGDVTARPGRPARR